MSFNIEKRPIDYKLMMEMGLCPIHLENKKEVLMCKIIQAQNKINMKLITLIKQLNKVKVNKRTTDVEIDDRGNIHGGLVCINKVKILYKNREDSVEYRKHSLIILQS